MVGSGSMDLIIVILLIILTVVFFRRFSNVVYVVCIIDIFLKILDKLDKLLRIPEYSNLVNKYFHNSILDIIGNYTSGIIFTIFSWIILGIYIVFLFYVIRTFFRKKK